MAEKIETKKTNDAEALSFEAGLARLDEILHALEADGAPLDTLMQLYEEGVGLLRRCNEQLETAEQKVKILKISPDGTRAHLEPFDADAEETT